MPVAQTPHEETVAVAAKLLWEPLLHEHDRTRGAVHTAFAVCYGELSPDAVWFAGAGLALVFLGLLNVAAGVASSAQAWTLCRVANVLGVAFGVPAAIAVWEPQGYLGLLLLVALTVTSLMAAGTPQSGTPGLPRAAVTASAVLFALLAFGAGYQFVGCVADGHPWYQIATWALVAVAFGSAAWLYVRRTRGIAGEGGPRAV